MARLLPGRTRPLVGDIGAVSDPTSGTVDCVVTKATGLPIYQLAFTLTKARIPVTDAAGSGSSGSLKIFDFAEGALTFLGCRQDYTSCVTASALDTGAGDAAYVYGVGTTAATAGDGTLTTTMQNVGTKTGTITNVAGTGAGTQVDGAIVAGINGTATAADLYLNWSGTAATIDANSTIDVTGTITVSVMLNGDD